MRKLHHKTNPSAAMADEIHVRVFESRTLTIDQSWNTPNVQSAYWRLYFNFADGASLILPDRQFGLDSKRLYFVPAGVRFSCSNTASVEHFYVHFDMLRMPMAAASSLFAAPIALPSDCDAQHEAEAIALEMSSNGRSDLRMQCRIKALIYIALAEFFGGLTIEQVYAFSQMSRAIEPLRPALEKIETSFVGHVTTAELASLCAMSPDYFIRRFRQAIGRTPTDFILDRRVNSAAQRLIFTDDAIELIAENSGFGNRYYFTRMFSKRIGISPAAYRAMSRQ